MRTYHQVVVLIFITFCGTLGLSEAKTIHFNATAALAVCNQTSENVCNFTDPVYWVEKVAPVDGDTAVIEDADVILKIVGPLHLASLQITIRVDSGITTTIDVDDLTVDKLNSAGFVSVIGGGLRVEPAMGYGFSGNVAFTNFTADSLSMDKGVFSANNIYTRYLIMGTFTSLQCDTINTASLIATQINCRSINVTGSGSATRPSAAFSGPVIADSVTIGGSPRLVSIFSSMTVKSFTVTAEFELFLLYGNLTSATPLSFPHSISRRVYDLSGTITAPSVNFYRGNWQANNKLTIIGDVNFNGTTLEQKGSVNITGNVVISESTVTIIIGFPLDGVQTIKAPVMKINGNLTQAHFSVEFIVKYFACPPTNTAVKFMEYDHGEISSIIADGPMGTTFDITSQYAAFWWNLDSSSPMNSPTGHDNGSASVPSTLEIGLIVVCVVLVVVVIGLIIALAKKRTARGYERIQS